MDISKKYILGDLINIELNKYNYVWVGIDFGGNYDLFTGVSYTPENVDHESVGKIMDRHEYYNMFPVKYPEIKMSLYNKVTNYLPFQ